MIPLVHDFGDETVLIFGGGHVGARRARTFEEARVVVVSPTFADVEFGETELVRAAPEPGDVRGWIDRVAPALVVAATDDEAFNDAVATVADDANVLLNRVDRSADGAGRVDVPAIVRDGSVVASVSTGGSSPSLSADLRERVGDALAGSGAMATVAARIRADLRERGLPKESRRRALRAVVDNDAIWRAIRDGGDARSIADAVVDRVLDTTANQESTDR